MRVLMVCLGNICRSPTAEGVFRGLAQEAGLLERLCIDSAGVMDYHAGSPPDRRAPVVCYFNSGLVNQFTKYHDSTSPVDLVASQTGQRGVLEEQLATSLRVPSLERS